MNRKLALALAALAGMAWPSGSVQAGVRIGLRIGIPLFVPCYRPPVYVAPPPPPVYVVPAQAPVYVQPAPVYQIPASPTPSRQPAGALVAVPQTPPPPLAARSEPY